MRHTFTDNGKALPPSEVEKGQRSKTTIGQTNLTLELEQAWQESESVEFVINALCLEHENSCYHAEMLDPEKDRG